MLFATYQQISECWRLAHREGLLHWLRNYRWDWTLCNYQQTSPLPTPHPHFEDHNASRIAEKTAEYDWAEYIVPLNWKNPQIGCIPRLLSEVDREIVDALVVIFHSLISTSVPLDWWVATPLFKKSGREREDRIIDKVARRWLWVKCYFY